jgi:TatD DNase family protein
MIDTHTHLYFDWYDSDREAVIAESFASGVKAVISIAINTETSALVYEQSQQYPQIYAAYGIHPNDAAPIADADIEVISDYIAKDPKAVAVGEVGLDYYRDYAPADKQKSIFRKMIALAKTTGKPLIIHNRDADADVLAILQEENAAECGGVFHCFSGDMALAKQLLDINFHISFTGNITYKKFAHPEVVKNFPLDRILLETDSPFLAPVPFRGKRNQPAYVKYVAEKMADLRGISVDEIITTTNANVKRLFGIEV